MNLKYREMNQNDYDDIIALWKNADGIGISKADSKENISKFLQRNKELSFVCQLNDKIIGTILCGHDGRRGYIYHMFVAEGYRKNGIGEKLVFLNLEKLKLAGIDKCHLFAFKENALGGHFWNKIGWNKRNDLVMYSKLT